MRITKLNGNTALRLVVMRQKPGVAVVGKKRLNQRRDSMGGLFKIIICAWLWLVVTVLFSQHPLPDMSVWASSISAAILMAGFIAYSGD